jgi:hypothetical protein
VLEVEDAPEHAARSPATSIGIRAAITDPFLVDIGLPLSFEEHSTEDGQDQGRTATR